MTHRQLSTVSDLWQQRSEDQYPTMWIGRSVFNRTGISAAAPIALPRHEHPDPAAMEDDEDAASGGVQHEGDPAEQELDGARVAVHPVQRPGGEGRRTKDQRAGIDDVSRAPGRGHEERNRACPKGVEGLTDAEDQGRPCTGRDRHDDRQVQGKLVPADPREVRRLGVGGGTPERGQHASRPEEVRDLATTQTDHGRKGHHGEHVPEVRQRPGGEREGPTAARERDGLRQCMVSGGTGAGVGSASSTTSAQCKSLDTTGTRRERDNEQKPPKMDQDVNEQVLEEIRALETRLATLRDMHQLAPQQGARK